MLGFALRLTFANSATKRDLRLLKYKEAPLFFKKRKLNPQNVECFSKKIFFKEIPQYIGWMKKL